MSGSLPFGPQRALVMRELARKSFHMLSLLYLAAYKLFGWPSIARPMLVWAAVVLVVETWRLRSPRLNVVLTDFFGGLARDDESDKYSGILHTTLGVLAVFAAFGARPAIVAASIYCAAFGDASAALVGRAIGRHKIASSSKSMEGSLACFLTCLAVGWFLDFPIQAAVLAAVAATVAEWLPTTRWYNDNFWMPIVTAGVLRLCAGF